MGSDRNQIHGCLGWRWGCWKEGSQGDTKEHLGVMAMLYLDCGGGFTGVYIPNSIL